MNRMTCYFDVDTAVLRDQCTFDRESSTEPDDCISCCELCEEKNYDCDECPMQKALNKLAEYEDLEEQDKLIKLPCKVGDTVYRICPKCNKDHSGSCENCAWSGSASNCGCTVYGLWSDGQYPAENCTIVPYKATWNYIPNLLEHLGRTVFLTQEAAEAALKES